jgi:alanine racemase
VVKAGGYGHGAVAAAEAALAGGAWGLAVASPTEAAELVRLAPPERVLVLGPVAPDAAAEVAGLGCAVTCSGKELAAALAGATAGVPIPVHLKVDTGMGRLGCLPAEAPELARYIAGAPGLELAGVSTHFAAAESDPEMTRTQFQAYLEVLAALPVDPGMRHACNSAALRRYPEMALDAVRTGIAIYGCEDPELEPALALHSRVAHLKTVPTGASVGYGASWTATEPARVATVPIGYADGVFRSRANRGWALVRGVKAPVIGMISMDAITLDVSGVEGVALGDVVTVIGATGPERITAEQVAEWSGTISYEVLTAIGPRVERRRSTAAAQE